MTKKANTKDYKKWIEEADFFYKRFNLIADKLEEFLINEVLVDEEFAKKVAKNMWTVFESCDEIDYQDYSLAVAYAISHFLDRYHRFQMSYSKLIDHKLLPITSRPIEILDIGTGPGPALYAISDIYLSLRKYGSEVGSKKFQKLKIVTDYVEQSKGFRDWLHYFTEYANYKNEEGWEVPYHFGTYEDFSKIEFDLPIRDFYGKEHIQKLRYRLIIFSNFLTKEEHLALWEEQILSCFYNLRNKGIFMVVGGRGEKYKPIHEGLDEKLLNTNWSSKTYSNKCKKKVVNSEHLTFGLDDKYGQRIKDFYRKIYSVFEKLDLVKEMDEKAQKRFESWIGPKTGRPKKWNMNVFEKSSRARFKHNSKYKKK